MYILLPVISVFWVIGHFVCFLFHIEDGYEDPVQVSVSLINRKSISEGHGTLLLDVLPDLTAYMYNKNISSEVYDGRVGCVE